VGSLSISLLFLATGCAVHLGVIPTTGAYSVAAVEAPVAEPDADVWVEEALVTALVSRHALDPAGPALHVTVTEAAWLPAQRAGDVLLYDARLTLRLQAGDRVTTQTRARSVVDPGSAGEARAAREAVFRALARQAAEDGVAWLLEAPAVPPG
jgi:hypothetical protein